MITSELKVLDTAVPAVSPTEAVVIPITKAQPPPVVAADPALCEACNCEGYCAQQRIPEFCANWLARTYKMTIQKCEVRVRAGIADQETFHRDGVCCECYPLFPEGTVFISV